mmetsp:Transcript_18700/g.34644  ORF Transcript_18700/g.34644 Transcript_18700/m.34644 type:complete len:82 (-) Transcript_18700:272-517(-)
MALPLGGSVASAVDVAKYRDARRCERVCIRELLGLDLSTIPLKVQESPRDKASKKILRSFSALGSSRCAAPICQLYLFSEV